MSSHGKPGTHPGLPAVTAATTRGGTANWSSWRMGGAIRNLDRDDDPLLAFSAAIIRPGEIARVTRLDGEDLVYRIVAVDAG